MSRHARFRTGDQALVREINLSVIMNQLREHAPISRATLADLTGLNKTTVSSLVTELIDHQFVHEVGFDTRGVGRPAMLLELNPSAGCILSCEIGVDFISVARANFAADVVWHHIEPHIDINQQEVIDRLLVLLSEAIGDADCNGLLGIALGVPGVVDISTGRLLFAPNLDWRDVPLEDILQETFPDIAIYVDNEANLAALGEHYFGAAQGFDEVLYISVGVGLGGGIIRSGTVFTGDTGFAGEFGHMTLDPDGLLCNCGNRGCWETLVSQAALFRRIRQAVNEGKNTVLVDLTNGDLAQLDIPKIAEAAAAGDTVTLQTLDEVGHDLGIGIASLVNALDPGLVVFGGMLSTVADYLMPALEDELTARTRIRANGGQCQVVLARHGSDACVMGGIATVFQAILADPGNVAWQAVP